MEKVKVLGVDPSLRNTGLALIEYDTETKKFSKPKHCQVLVNPAKYTGTEAILNMLDMLKKSTIDTPEYLTADTVIVESPPVMFNKSWSGGTIASIAHISGGAAAFFGIDKVHLFRPNEWNKNRKKEATHNNTIAVLGNADTWHYAQRVKSDKFMEHILDAASMGLFWIKGNYID